MLGHCFRCGWERTANNTAPESTLTKSCSYRFEPPPHSKNPVSRDLEVIKPAELCAGAVAIRRQRTETEFQRKGQPGIIGKSRRCVHRCCDCHRCCDKKT